MWREALARAACRPTVSRGRRRLPGDRRPSSHRTTPPQGAHRQRLQLFPDMGLRFPKCYSPSEGTAGEPLGRSPGQGAGSCRAAPEVAGAAVQSSTRRQGRAAASLSRPRAPRSTTQTGRWGRRLRGTALRAPPRGPTSRARGSPSAAAPQVRCLGQVIFFPGPQCPRLQIGNETASTLTQLWDDGQLTLHVAHHSVAGPPALPPLPQRLGASRAPAGFLITADVISMRMPQQPRAPAGLR